MFNFLQSQPHEDIIRLKKTLATHSFHLYDNLLVTDVGKIFPRLTQSEVSLQWSQQSGTGSLPEPDE
jgi:hypothetical protein